VSSRSARRLSATSLIGLFLLSPTVHAQYGMGGMGPGGMGQPPMGGRQQQPKDEGPAQQAPEEPGQPSDLEPIGGYADQNKRRAQMFELDGYFRLRTDFMYNFNLSQGYSNQAWTDALGNTQAGLPPFPTPIGCQTPPPGMAYPTNMPGTAGAACGTKSISTAAIRLRLEPTFNVTDQVRVRSQIDVLDNTIMGSTPDSLAGLNRPYGDFIPQAPVPFLYTSQDPPELGQNGYTSSIRAKRAWAEVDTEFGSLRFGRMPWHFGRGMSFNDGSCQDCNGGTTVDRVALLSQIYGHQLMLALDYGSQGLTSNQLAIGRYNSNGYPLDLGQKDDVFQYVFAVTNIDTPIALRERVDRGDVVLNYGLQLVYRSQDVTYNETCDQTTGMACVGSPTNGIAPATREQTPTPFTVNAFMFQPNLWLKLHYRALVVEFEGTAVLGKMDHGGILLAKGEENSAATFRQFGAVLASHLHLYREALFVGFEMGGASGDQAENPGQYLNYRWRYVRQPSNDHSLRDFKFSPEYHVDSILFRNLLGTVTNAIYAKPSVAYWFDLQANRQLGLAGSVIYSIAQVPVSTPGNQLGYGLETNVTATYRNTAEGFYAGATWGVLWPTGALDRPDFLGGDPLWGQGSGADAKAAQVVRGFLGVKF
jgi:uncharacterized protein (TIGR04551 family)